ncbi:MAG TPA: hypothetical protein VFS31_08370, partial [Chitinophagaceae bacterium]|nr:hypothetical protein [Chitinophagaceae bacterium]
MHFIKIKVLFLWAFLLPGIVMYGCSKEVAGTTYMQDTTRRELSADNGIIKLKLDLSRGGAISYVSLSGSSRNLVNIHDEGRYIQQSYYAGKPLNRQADGQNPAWSPWRWNPIQG